MFYKKSCKFKKILSGLILGLGAGMLLIIILPPKVWIVIFSISLIIVGIKKVCEK